MLWTKAWLETRWRLAHVFGLVLVVLFMGETGGGLGSRENAGRLMNMLLFLSVFAAVNLAGAGIRTQSPVRAGRGLHGSVYFTLSLPVSRFRLLAVRAAFGLLEMAGVSVFMIVSAWSLFPLVRGGSTWLDVLRLVFTAIVCTTCFYAVSTSIAAVLEETWQVYGSLLVIGVAWWATTLLRLPPSADIFRIMSDASPLVTHQLPWPAMMLAVAASTVLFWTALKIVQRQEH